MKESERAKAHWRQQAKDRRMNVTASEPAGLEPISAVAAAILDWLVAAQPDGWIVVYDALPGEVSLSEVERDPRLPKVALTRTPETGKDLTVHPAESPRENHRFGYSQPVAHAPMVADSEIAAVLVPALAFDTDGNRLGWGAGYYDRFLARLGSSVWKIGISDGFLVPELPFDDHDVSMTHVATDQGVVAVPFDLPSCPSAEGRPGR